MDDALPVAQSGIVTSPGRSEHRAEEGDLQLPALALGRHVLIDTLRRSAFGTLVRAYDPNLRREIALQIVPTKVLPEQGRERLLQETRAVASLSHQNVMPVYDVETAGADEEEVVVIAMEHVHGTTLRAWLEARHSARGSARHELWDVFVAVGRGLAAAHAAGLVHGGLTASSVLIGTDGRPRVTDFGVAHLGTDRPPPADATLDQHAFCVMLWEALTGRTWTPADDLRTPTWPRGVVVPNSIKRAIARGLAAEPEQRWPDMNGLLDVLARDQVLRRRNWVLAAGAIAVAGASVFVLHAHEQTQAQRCSGGRTHIEDAWGPARRELVERAIIATSVADAGSAWRSLHPQLDEYARAWVAMHTDACAATSVRGDQTAGDLDLRMRCLHRAKQELGATTDLLARADEQVVKRTHALVAGLPRLDRCADIDALRLDVAPPDPEDEKAVESVRDALAEVRAVGRAGKYQEGLRLAESASRRAAEIGYPPLEVDALLELGLAQLYAGAYADGESSLENTLRLALRWKHFQAAQMAASRLVQAVGALQSRPVEGLAYAETARGLLAEGDRLAKADLRGDIAEVLYMQGNYADAEREFRLALAEQEALYGRDHESLIVNRNSLASALHLQGRYAEAEALYRALVLQCEAKLGGEHPYVPTMRSNLGMVLSATGRHEDAVREIRSAIDLWKKSVGLDHPLIPHSQLNLAAALEGQGHHAEAEAELRSAIARWEASLGPTHSHVASARTSLGVNLEDQRRYAEAEDELRRALGLWRHTIGGPHPKVALTLHALGASLAAQGRHEEAEHLLLESVAQYEATVGCKHREAVRAVIVASDALDRRGRDDHGAVLLERCWQQMQDAEALPVGQRQAVALRLAHGYWKMAKTRLLAWR